MLGSLFSVHVKEGFGLSTVQVNECKLLEPSATISGQIPYLEKTGSGFRQ